MESPKKTGLTKSAGYQAGVRRTLDVTLEEAWSFLLSKKGLELWLGTSELEKWETGIEFISENGLQGAVRVFKIYSHIRLSWKKKDWPNTALLQLRTIPVGGRTTFSFHMEHLLDEKQRIAMKVHWADILTAIENELSPGQSEL